MMLLIGVLKTAVVAALSFCIIWGLCLSFDSLLRVIAQLVGNVKTLQTRFKLRNL
jgi:hypothetical protein